MIEEENTIQIEAEKLPCLMIPTDHAFLKGSAPDD
jgi:hypothetical protein